MKNRLNLCLCSAMLALLISLPVMGQVIFKSGFEDLVWQQLGADIDGEAAADNSGESVSLSADGSRVAIGAPLNGGNGDYAGHVRVYQWSGSDWQQLGGDIDGEADRDRSGSSVSLSSDGSRVAIGAPQNDGNGIGNGHVRVYQWSGSAWQQLGADIDGEAVGDGSGSSVSLSADGSRVAIGAQGNGGYAGHVRVYQWSGSAWQQIGADIDGEADGDFSGSVSLSADGSRVAIGAKRNDGSATDSGHVRVYQWSGSAWQQLGADIDGEAAGDLSGLSVSLSAAGGRVAIGANGNDNVGGYAAGHVRVYQWSGSVWQQLGADIDGKALEAESGWSVSLSADGSRVVIGAFNDNVRVYQWSGLAWQQLGADIEGEAANEGFGRSVSLSADGSRAAIGAPFNDGNGTDSGHARVFGWE